MAKRLNPKQELFCQSYVNNKHTFGNSTLSYALAYDIDADDKGTVEQKGNYNVAKSAGGRLLTNVAVKSRVVKLLNALMKDDVVDAELAKVIQQDQEMSSKVSAIREYNKLKNRVTDQVKLTGTLSLSELFEKAK